jgi:hypothetical protein
MNPTVKERGGGHEFFSNISGKPRFEKMANYDLPIRPHPSRNYGFHGPFGNLGNNGDGEQ